MKKNWWKVLAIVLVSYSIVGGFLVPLPEIQDSNIGETMRNIFYHVGMWFAMIIVLFISMINSIKALSSMELSFDVKAEEGARVGVVLGVLGILTGMVWAKFTWYSYTPLFSLDGWWANDPKLRGALIGVLMYLAYMVLRSSIEDENKKAKVSAVYNILAFVLFIVFIGVLPRLTSGSVHAPGTADGNPAFGDMDPSLRWVFYPAVVGWILLAHWIVTLRSRIQIVKNRIDQFKLEN